VDRGLLGEKVEDADADLLVCEVADRQDRAPRETIQKRSAR
jgi:hypothetical protein